MALGQAADRPDEAHGRSQATRPSPPARRLAVKASAARVRCRRSWAFQAISETPAGNSR